MNFLITGGAGFLGAALSNRLFREGHHVRVLDDLSTGDPDALDPEIHFTRGDINDRPKLWTLLQDVDCVYHLAARVSVPESVLFPRDYNEVNVGGTVTLMEAIRDAGTPRVILASSGAVYGDQESSLLSESLQPNPDVYKRQGVGRAKYDREPDRACSGWVSSYQFWRAASWRHREILQPSSSQRDQGFPQLLAPGRGCSRQAPSTCRVLLAVPDVYKRQLFILTNFLHNPAIFFIFESFGNIFVDVIFRDLRPLCFEKFLPDFW